MTTINSIHNKEYIKIFSARIYYLCYILFLLNILLSYSHLLHLLFNWQVYIDTGKYTLSTIKVKRRIFRIGYKEAVTFLKTDPVTNFRSLNNANTVLLLCTKRSYLSAKYMCLLREDNLIFPIISLSLVVKTTKFGVVHTLSKLAWFLSLWT